MSITETRVVDYLENTQSAEILEYLRRKRKWYIFLSRWTDKIDIVSLTAEDRQMAIDKFTEEYDDACKLLEEEANTVEVFLDGLIKKKPTVGNFPKTKPAIGIPVEKQDEIYEPFF